MKERQETVRGVNSENATCALLLLFLVVLSFQQSVPVTRFQLRLSNGVEPHTTIVTFVVDDQYANGSSPSNPPQVLLTIPETNQTTAKNVTIQVSESIRYATGWIYRAVLQNLYKLSQKYTVQVFDQLAGSSPAYQFYPLDLQPIRTVLVMIGAIDTGFQVYAPVIINFFENEYGAGVIPGSVANGYNDTYFSSTGRAIESFSGRFPLFVAAGPTDFDANGTAWNWENRFKMPTVGSNQFYYSSDFSGIHFVTISTFTNYTRNSPQYQWLESDLKAANENRANFPWIIMTGYSSMYNALGSDLLFREEIEPLILKYGVDLCAWNGHYFGQSRPISGREISERFLGDGNITTNTPYFNTAPVHILVGTGGVNLATNCTGLSRDWQAQAVCTFGMTNVTVDSENGLLYGMFRQLTPLTDFTIRKNLQMNQCPFNCQDNGYCDQFSLKCVCNANYYGTDCGIFMETSLVITRGETWEFLDSHGNVTFPTDEEWSAAPTGVAPMGIDDNDVPAAQANQFQINYIISGDTAFFRKKFDLDQHPGNLFNVSMTIKFTRVPTAVFLNGKNLPFTVGDEAYNFYYGGNIVLKNSDLVGGAVNFGGSNTLGFYYEPPFLYFESSVDLDSRCVDGFTGSACTTPLDPNMQHAYSYPSTQPGEIVGVLPKTVNVTAIVTGIVGGLIFIAVVTAVLFVVWRWKFRNPKLKKEELKTPDGILTPIGSPGKEWEVNYEDLEIGRRLGEGAFGIVYQAKWRNAACVVKEMKVNSEDKLAMKDFLREAHNMKRLRPHPNVTDLLGVCTAPEKPICIITEYLSEGSLSELISAGKINIDAKLALNIAKDVAAGMAHLHEEKILHCDLAARNLLVALKGKDDYVVKVADFGLSHIAAESENYNINAEAKFPVRWSAPELMTRHQVSQKSDIWSYGVSMWEIIEQKIPYFHLPSNSDVREAVCKGEKLSRPTRIQISDDFWNLILSCFAYEPRDRPLFQELCQRLSQMSGVQRPISQVPMGQLPSEYSKTPANSPSFSEAANYAISPASLEQSSSNSPPSEFKNTAYAPIRDANADGDAEKTEVYSAIRGKEDED
eukprot:TRINITY_DN5472_c0_g1_i2.p1 TRINITY_DN5472_c0_g1~~TRINITY_DN5472_c0_g1_i2.p1  ORF type:complete len:1076 (+),score=303.21 TRINITY_DN5472_c0_g1_i2:3249-6476(+)